MRECQDADAAGQFSTASSCFSPDSEPGDDRNPEGREVQDVYAMALVSPASSCYGPDSEPRERSASISMSSEIRRQGPRGRRRRDQGDQEHEQNKKQDDRQTNKQYQGARWTPRGQMRMHPLLLLRRLIRILGSTAAGTHGHGVPLINAAAAGTRDAAGAGQTAGAADAAGSHEAETMASDRGAAACQRQMIMLAVTVRSLCAGADRWQ